MGNLKDIQVGDIFFTMNNSLISRAIRLVETGQHNQEVPSHVGIIESIMPYDEPIVIEATYSGVRTCPLIPTYNKNTVWLGRMRKPRDIEKGLEWCRTKIGTSYDYVALIGILLRAFFRILGPDVYDRISVIRNYLNSRTKFFCSEYVSYYGRLTGQDLWHCPDGQTTPYDLYRSSEIVIYQKFDCL